MPATLARSTQRSSFSFTFTGWPACSRQARYRRAHIGAVSRVLVALASRDALQNPQSGWLRCAVHASFRSKRSAASVKVCAASGLNGGKSRILGTTTAAYSFAV